MKDNTRHLIRIQNLVPKQQILSPMRRFIMEASFPTNYFAKTKKSSKRLESGRSKSLRLNHNEKENKGRHSLSSSSLRALEKDAGFVQAHFYLFDDALVLQSTKEKTKSAFLHLTTMWSITQPGAFLTAAGRSSRVGAPTVTVRPGGQIWDACWSW